jgi:hypothetical protein
VSFCDRMRRQRGASDATLSIYKFELRGFIKKLGGECVRRSMVRVCLKWTPHYSRIDPWTRVKVSRSGSNPLSPRTGDRRQIPRDPGLRLEVPYNILYINNLYRLLRWFSGP